MLDNFVEIFFMVGGPTGTAPLDTACFWIEDPSRYRLALNGISAINLTRFFEKNSNIFLKFLFYLEKSGKVYCWNAIDC